VKIHEKFMKKCLDLAILGLNKTKSNPLVGCVIVHNNKIISTGYHQEFGGPHAEANALHNLKKSQPSDYKNILKESTIYINLEPCSHYGKTPPCLNLIIKYQIKKIVIGTIDPFKKVNGSSIQKLKKNAEVIVGVKKKECEAINQRYFINQRLQRPFIIIKWAESKDGFINNLSTGITRISCEESIALTHQWRSEIDAIMVGTNTVLSDNPQLTTRKFVGANPVRVTIDRNNKLSDKKWNIKNQDAPTIILHEQDSFTMKNIHYLDCRQLDTKENNSDQTKMAYIMKLLYENGITSILIEGGTTILNNIISQGLWDEARIFISNKNLHKGQQGPTINFKTKKYKTTQIGEDKLFLIKNNHNTNYTE